MDRAIATIRNRAIVATISLMLIGCGHNLYLVGRTSGEKGTASVQRAPGQKSGDVSIALRNKTYSGRWIYVASGGVTGFGVGTAFSGASYATGTGTFVGASSHGVGTILASAPDGSTLRCEFQFNSMGNTGIGTCQDETSEIYDLQID